jgi:hypothetical protein
MGPVDGLIDALDRVHEDLRAGRYDALEALATELEAAIHALPGLPLGALEALRRRAARNSACLAASILGLKSARRRIGEIMDMQGGTGTYDSRGRRDAAGSMTGRLSARL